MAKHSAPQNGRLVLQISATLISVAAVTAGTVTISIHHNKRTEIQETVNTSTTSPAETTTPIATTSSDELVTPTSITSTSSTFSGADQLTSIIENTVAGYAGTWQVYVQNLADGAISQFNSHPQPGASLLKLFVMLAVYDSIDQGQLANSSTVQQHLQQMITVSSNSSANSLLSLLGDGDMIAGFRIVNNTAARYGFNDTSLNDSFHDDGSGPANEKLTSARDTGLFLAQAYNGKLPHSQEMISLLKQQQRNTKISLGIPTGVPVAHKTGEVPGVENDAALIYGSAQNTDQVLVLTVLTNGVSSGTARQQIGQLAKQVYNEIGRESSQVRKE